MGFRMWVALIFAAAAVAACGVEQTAEQPGWQERLDPALAEVSSELAVMQAMAESDVELHCTVAEMFTNVTSPSEDELAVEVLQSLQSEAVAQCSLSEKARAASNSVAALAKETRRVPSPLHAFVVVTSEAGTYTAKSIGPFLTEKECIEVEAVAREADLATKACRIWMPFEERMQALRAVRKQ